LKSQPGAATVKVTAVSPVSSAITNAALLVFAEPTVVDLRATFSFTQVNRAGSISRRTGLSLGTTNPRSFL
jgi:hypothetical protein